MLGHSLWLTLRDRFEAYVTVRRPASAYLHLDLFDPRRLIDRLDATLEGDRRRAFETARPEVVVNCVGLIKQLKEAEDPVAAITVNSLLPHKLAALCQAEGARLIQISTDCVFSGESGGYTEDDPQDARDLYGRSKGLGEVGGSGAVTLRTSMIGREIGTRNGLLEWFLAHRGGRVSGYRGAIYTGFTTQVLSRIIADVIERHRDLTGIWHVSSDPIDKCTLLETINRVLDLGIRIDADDSVRCDRSLDSSRFRERTSFAPPSWPEMIEGLRADTTPYDRWRSAR